MSSTITQSSASDRPSLPLDILREITGRLDSTEQRNMTLVSRVVRDQILDIVFQRLSFTRRLNVRERIRGSNQVREDVKSAVRALQVHIQSLGLLIGNNTIFQLLRSLPNLQALEYIQFIDTFHPHELFDSIRHAPLSELTLDTRCYFFAEGPSAEGITSLKKLSISWTGDDSRSMPGSSLWHQLYHLIKPALSSLVELKVDPSETDLDLGSLREAGETLRVFDYSMRNQDEGVLDLIPEIFPHLTKLVLQWGLIWRKTLKGGCSLRWKDSYIHSLSKNKNLLYLQLSFDFEYDQYDLNDTVARRDSNYAWYIRCYKRRLDATNKLLGAMPLLRTCRWLQLWAGSGLHDKSMIHPFVVEERGMASRVVRGVKQSWMGADRKSCWETGSMIVKCKLEDLPGEIIGENDPSDDDDEGLP